MQREKLSKDPSVPKTLGAHSLPDWESYWSFSSSKKGFNGVTTFVRKGMTCAAEGAPLGDAALDAEGRCVMTDHGSFVLLNVYVHARGPDEDGSRLALKLSFLGALRRKMQALRPEDTRSEGREDKGSADPTPPVSDSPEPRRVVLSMNRLICAGPPCRQPSRCPLR